MTNPTHLSNGCDSICSHSEETTHFKYLYHYSMIYLVILSTVEKRIFTTNDNRFRVLSTSSQPCLVVTCCGSDRLYSCREAELDNHSYLQKDSSNS